MKKFLLTLIVIVIVVAGAWWLMIHDAKAPVETATPTVSHSTSPTASAKPTATTTATAQQNITITSPKAGAVISSPITVTGKARVFENQFSVAVTTLDGHVIVKKE